MYTNHWVPLFFFFIQGRYSGEHPSIYGGGEIRTLGGLTPTTVFKTAAFNRSATPPGFTRRGKSPLLPGDEYLLKDRLPDALRFLVRTDPEIIEREFIQEQLKADRYQQKIQNIYKGKPENIVGLKEIALTVFQRLCGHDQMERQ